MKINFRKFICGILNSAKYRWLWKIFDCERYEKTLPVIVCAESKKRPKSVCPELETRYFRIDDIPDEFCPIHEETKAKICLDSFLLANEGLCPWIEEKLYLKGTEPREICKIHIPKPKPELEIGLSAYQLIQYPLEDIEWFLDRVAENGGRLTEVFICFGWDKGADWSLFKKIGTWREDDGSEFPLFSIKEFNDFVTEKYVKMFKMVKERDIKPYLRIQDYCSLKDWASKRRYCFVSFKEQYEFGGNVIGGIWPPLSKNWRNEQHYLWYWYHRLNKHLISILKEANIFEDAYFVPMNEADYLSDPGDSEELKDRKVYDFHKFYFESLTELGVKKENIIFCVSRAENLLESFGCVFEVHQINSPERLREELAKGKIIFPNGDGPDPYAQGPADSIGYRNPSVEQALEMRKILLASPVRRYGLLSREYEMGEESDLKKINYEFRVLKALALGIKS